MELNRQFPPKVNLFKVISLTSLTAAKNAEALSDLHSDRMGATSFTIVWEKPNDLRGRKNRIIIRETYLSKIARLA